MTTVEDRVKQFTVMDLQSCYVLYDKYWDDGLNDEKTLINIKNKLLGTSICPHCGIDINGEKVERHKQQKVI